MFTGVVFTPKLTLGINAMTKYLNIAKGAVLTATAVLIVIYIARKAPVVGPITGPLVNKALMG